MSLRDITSKLGIPKTTVSRLHDAAVECLRAAVAGS